MSQKILVFLLLKENGSNRVVETTREEYNMDGTIVFNPEFDEGTGFILQEFKVFSSEKRCDYGYTNGVPGDGRRRKLASVSCNAKVLSLCSIQDILQCGLMY